MTSDDRGSAATDMAEQEPRSSRSGGRPTAKRKHLPLWQETILLLGIALVLAIVIKAFFIQAFYIPSESMEPGLVEDDRILVQKVSYWGGGDPQRGDVVVFKDPGGWLSNAESGPTGGLTGVMEKVGLYPSGGHLVKRVIGVAGDTIECCDDQGRILVNGVPLNEEDYVQAEDAVKCRGPMKGCDWRAGPVPDGHVFVMGDNRAHSADSTVHMCEPRQETDCVPGEEFVPVDLVVGKVFVVLWPQEHFRWVKRPDTFEDVAAAP